MKKDYTPVTGRDAAELDAPRFSLGEAAEAIGIAPAKLSDWLRPQCHYVPAETWETNIPALGRGTRRLVSLRTVLHFAVMAELIGAGFRPNRAADFALQFSHTGHGDPSAMDKPDFRSPGELFWGGETLLVIRRGMARVLESYAIEDTANERLAHTIIDISAIHERVTASLNEVLAKREREMIEARRRAASAALRQGVPVGL